MKKLFVLFVLALLLASGVRADEGVAYLGYCDGAIAEDGVNGKVTGVTGTGATVNMAICIPSSMLSPYAGGELKAVRWGVPEAEKMPSTVKGWVRSEQKGENLTEGTLSTVEQGWNEISFDTPITITAETGDLWFGVEFVQENVSKYTVISLVGETNVQGCYIGKNGNFTDYSSKSYGSLSIEAVVEGNILTRDLGFLQTYVASSVVKLGENIQIGCNIKNLASATCVNPILRYSVNQGEHTGSLTIPATLNYRDTQEFTLTIPTKGWADECTADIELTLLWGETEQDEAPYNNSAQLSVEVVKVFPTRVMVCEEATGAWCGWCPRGIVGLKTMTERYPDTFIGIAVHSGDSYAVSDYNDWIGTIITAYPQCVNNRDGQENTPSADALESYMQSMNKVAEATMTVEAEARDGQVTMTSHTTFMASHSGADFRVVFVVEEDSLPIYQTNYFAGGGSGVMGGFEKLGSPTLVYVDDVARGIYPSALGYEGSVPKEIVKRVNYDYTYTTTLPTIKDLNKVRVVALLLNTRTGELMQAARTPYLSSADGVENLETSKSRNLENSEVYDLQGRRVARPVHGVYIEGGKKIMK